MSGFLEEANLYASESVKEAFGIVTALWKKMERYADEPEMVEEIALADATHDGWEKMRAGLSGRAKELLDMTPHPTSENGTKRTKCKSEDTN